MTFGLDLDPGDRVLVLHSETHNFGGECGVIDFIKKVFSDRVEVAVLLDRYVDKGTDPSLRWFTSQEILKTDSIGTNSGLDIAKEILTLAETGGTIGYEVALERINILLQQKETKSRTISVWKFADAPEELRALSNYGGDEDWIAMLPCGMDSWEVGWVDTGSFSACGDPQKTVYNGQIVLIGAHA